MSELIYEGLPEEMVIISEETASKLHDAGYEAEVVYAIPQSLAAIFAGISTEVAAPPPGKAPSMKITRSSPLHKARLSPDAVKMAETLGDSKTGQAARILIEKMRPNTIYSRDQIYKLLACSFTIKEAGWLVSSMITGRTKDILTGER